MFLAFSMRSNTASPFFVRPGVAIALAIRELDVLVGHFQEQQIGELLDVVAVANGCDAKRGAGAPHSGNATA